MASQKSAKDKKSAPSTTGSATGSAKSAKPKSKGGAPKSKAPAAPTGQQGRPIEGGRSAAASFLEGVQSRKTKVRVSETRSGADPRMMGSRSEETDPHYKLIDQRAIEGRLKLGQQIVKYGPEAGRAGATVPMTVMRGAMMPGASARGYSAEYFRPAQSRIGPSAFHPKEPEGFLSSIANFLFGGGSETDVPSVSMVSRGGRDDQRTVEFLPASRGVSGMAGGRPSSSLGQEVSLHGRSSFRSPMGSPFVGREMEVQRCQSRWGTMASSYQTCPGVDAAGCPDCFHQITGHGVPIIRQVGHSPLAMPQVNAVVDVADQETCREAAEAQQEAPIPPPSPMVYLDHSQPSRKDDRFVSYGGFPPSPMTYHIQPEEPTPAQVCEQQAEQQQQQQSSADPELVGKKPVLTVVAETRPAASVAADHLPECPNCDGSSSGIPCNCLDKIGLP